MAEIPTQLKGWRFIKLRPRDKVPIEVDWPNRTYAWGDPELLEWIERGGNFGVIGDETHVIIDGDTAEVQEAVEKISLKLSPSRPQGILESTIILLRRLVIPSASEIKITRTWAMFRARVNRWSGRGASIRTAEDTKSSKMCRARPRQKRRFTRRWPSS